MASEFRADPRWLVRRLVIRGAPMLELNVGMKLPIVNGILDHVPTKK